MPEACGLAVTRTGGSPTSRSSSPFSSFDSAVAALDPEAFFLELGDPLYTSVWSSTTTLGDGGASDAMVVDFARGTIHSSAKEPGYAPAYSRAVRTLEPVRHGDLNGDGVVDLSDPVRLLIVLFVDSNAASTGPSPACRPRDRRAASIPRW